MRLHNRQKIYIFLLLLPVFMPIHSQEQHQAQLQWHAVDGAQGYYVKIRPVAGGRTIEFRTESTESTQMLEPGQYRVMITPINKFGNREENTNWQRIHVSRLPRPRITGFSPTYTANDTNGTIRIRVTGSHFRRDTTFYLRRNGRRYTPQRVSFRNSNSVTLHFNSSRLRNGRYTLVAVNSAGQKEKHALPLAVGLEALAQRNVDHPRSGQTRQSRRFFLGVASGDEAAVREILKDSFNPDTPDPHGFYAVHYAAYMGNLTILKILHAYGADLRVRDRRGARALHHSAYKGHLAVVRYLVGYGYNNVNILTDNGYAPLDRAALNGHNRICSYLIEKGALINHTFTNGESALHMATYNGDKETVQVFLNNSSTMIDQQDKRGFTPLHYAGYYGHETVTRLLLEHGADSTMQSVRGEKPVDLARRSPYSTSSVIRVLEQHQASP